MKEDRYEIRFSGSGGQGIITMAVIFAEAAALYEGKYVCQTQNYGPEARGGASKAEVVISSTEIDYPRAIQLDMLLAMNQTACDAYFFDCKPNGLLLADSTLVEQLPTSRVVSIPFTQIARETIGKEFVANVVALGAIGHLCDVVSAANLEAVLESRVPPATRDINRKAFRAGIKAARKTDLGLLPQSIVTDEEEV